MPREQILMRHTRAKPGIFDIGDFDLIQEMTTEDYSYWMPRPGKIAKDSLADLNLQALPDPLIARLARGEHPYSVLISALDQGMSQGELFRLPAADKEHSSRITMKGGRD